MSAEGDEATLVGSGASAIPLAGAKIRTTGRDSGSGLDDLTLQEINGRLHEALAHRDVIGQAKGILMERFGITDENAFARLVTFSQQKNRKLHLIAADIARTGELPE